MEPKKLGWRGALCFYAGRKVDMNFLEWFNNVFNKKNEPEVLFGIDIEKVYAFQRSELLKEDSCAFCKQMDNLVVEPQEELVRVGEFHPGCRGIWAAILKDETNPPPIKGITEQLRNEYKKLI